jgi:DNA sulfur modification protein DndC
MKGMLQSGEEWMEPLDSFRDKLRVYRNDETKRNKRKRNNTRGVGPFLLEVRKEFLRELLEIETLINHTLIKDEEIKQIQKYWNLDGDIANSAIKIANSFNRNLEIIEINHIEKYLLDYKDEANLELFKRVYEIEKHRKNISNRYKISEEIKEVVLNYYRGEFNENS